MVTFIKSVTFDCRDALATAQFWAAALGSNVDEDSTTDKAYVEAAGWGGPNMWFRRVPEPKVAKNRLHFDLRAPARVDAQVRDPRAPARVDDQVRDPRAPARVEDEVRRLTELGAVVVRRDEELVVMQDPEGNEFCVE